MFMFIITTTTNIFFFFFFFFFLLLLFIIVILLLLLLLLLIIIIINNTITAPDIIYFLFVCVIFVSPGASALLMTTPLTPCCIPFPVSTCYYLFKHPYLFSRSTYFMSLIVLSFSMLLFCLAP